MNATCVTSTSTVATANVRLRKTRQLKQRMIHAQLASHEDDKHRHARDKQAKRHWIGDPRRLGNRHARHARNKPHNILQRRNRIEAPWLLPRVPDVFQKKHRHDHHGKRHRTEQHKHRMPAPRVDEKARYGRADGGREPDNEADDPHRLAVLARRIERERHHLQKRKADAGAARLHEPRREQKRVVRSNERGGASRNE